MKWALIFYVLNLGFDGQPIMSDHRILQTFVMGHECRKTLYTELNRASKIAKEVGISNPTNIYIACVPYRGPWKKEVKGNGRYNGG